MYREELLSPCGLYCGVCGIHKAGVDKDEPLKEKLAKLYVYYHDHGSLGAGAKYINLRDPLDKLPKPTEKYRN